MSLPHIAMWINNSIGISGDGDGSIIVLELMLVQHNKDALSQWTAGDDYGTVNETIIERERIRVAMAHMHWTWCDVFFVIWYIAKWFFDHLAINENYIIDCGSIVIWSRQSVATCVRVCVCACERWASFNFPNAWLCQLIERARLILVFVRFVCRLRMKKPENGSVVLWKSRWYDDETQNPTKYKTHNMEKKTTNEKQPSYYYT